jgi:hypothetical protein
MRSCYFENPGSHPLVALILDDGPIKSKDYPLSTLFFFSEGAPPRWAHLDLPMLYIMLITTCACPLVGQVHLNLS